MEASDFDFAPGSGFRLAGEEPRLDDAADRLAAEFVPADGWDAGSLPDDLAVLLDSVFLESVPGRVGSFVGSSSAIGPDGPICDRPSARDTRSGADRG